MASWKYQPRIDGAFFIVVLIIYLAGQMLIGAYLPQDQSFHYDAPADVDFLYYAGILNQMEHSFPPQNPAYGGVPLSQSFVQYYPTMLISMAVNPYLAMRIANLLFLLLLAFLLRRYFPHGWGVGLALISAASVGFGLINSLGMDLIARGFNHLPFFIAFVIALFERRIMWLRYLCLFLLGWLHSFSGMLAFLYLAGMVIVERFERQSWIDALVCLAGLVSAAAITLGVADKTFYFPFVEGFRIDANDLWMHAVPALALVVLAGRKRPYMLFAVAFLFGLVFHYNPFFPVFMLYFAGGWAAMEIIRGRAAFSLVPVILAGLMLIGFVIGAFDKYDPRVGNFIPIIDPEYTEAREWLAENTPSDAVVMLMPIDPAIGICRIMEVRAVYLGFIPHVAHLGIDWRPRAQKIIDNFLKPSVYMAEIDYIGYGPYERKLFPNFDLIENPVFQKGSVKIWKTLH